MSKLPPVSADVVSARLEWEDSFRVFSEAARDPVADERLRSQLDAVTNELRRRIGGTFTIRELAAVYSSADRWARQVLAEHGAPGWPITLSIVEGAAFHIYARGATDYEP